MSRDRADVYTIGFLGSMAILSAIVIFLWGTIFQTTNQVTFIVAVVILVTGLALSAILGNLKLRPFDSRFFLETIMWTAVSFFLILIVNKVTPISFAVTPFDERTFAVLMGVAEECFFRLGLCAMLKKLTGSSILSVVISSVIWTLYHIGRYGGTPTALFVVFLAGLVLGTVFLTSKMGDGVIFAHAIVNFLAVTPVQSVQTIASVAEFIVQLL